MVCLPSVLLISVAVAQNGKTARQVIDEMVANEGVAEKSP